MEIDNEGRFIMTKEELVSIIDMSHKMLLEKDRKEFPKLPVGVGSTRITTRGPILTASQSRVISERRALVEGLLKER